MGKNPVRRLADAAIAGVLGLPAARGHYAIERIRVPMRDGIVLLGEHYRPHADPVGTILIRTPYHRGLPFSLAFADPYAARGYHVVVQNVRGTFGSQGRFDPVVNEADDGADTVAWLRGQPWFTGTFATIGLSYLGLTQWALMRDPPPELAAAVVTVGVHDFAFGAWGTGAFALDDLLTWSYLVSHQEDRGWFRTNAAQPIIRRKLLATADRLPLGVAGRELLKSGARWYESWLEHPDITDRFWAPYRFNDVLERTRVPTLLIGGWQDLLLPQTMMQYRRLHDRGVDVALTVGPWTHTEVTGKALGVVTRESLDWLDCHLGGSPGRARRPAVRVFVTDRRVGGARHRAHTGWHSLPQWPPATAEQAWFLHPGGQLSRGTSASGVADSEQVVCFGYDPACPVPTIGGRLLSRAGGYREDTRLANHDDVVCFTSEELTDGIWVAGTPIAELHHDSDTPHVDVFVRVSEVDPRGRSCNVSDGYRRLSDSPGLVRIELDQIAHRFSAGSRIRVLIAGGSHPRFSRNLGTGAPPLTAKRLRLAVHTLRLGSSRVVLPVAAPGLP